MQQIFKPKAHNHSLRERNLLEDCTPTDVMGSTPKEGVRVTLLGMVTDLLLGSVKMVAGALSGSNALMADGVHSFSDALTDVAVIAMMRYSRQPPDDDHPYGHERFETIGTVLMGCALLAVAAGIVIDNAVALNAQKAAMAAGWLATTVAIVSIVVKEALFHITRAVGEKIQSALIISNAWHSRTDAISSALVLIAIVGASMGLAWLDFVAAIAVGLVIGKVGLGMTLDNVKELVDTAMAPDKRSRLRAVIEQHPGLDELRSLRSRRMGSDYLVECVVSLPGHLTLSQGNQVTREIRERVLGTFPDVREVILQVEAA